MNKPAVMAGICRPFRSLLGGLSWPANPAWAKPVRGLLGMANLAGATLEGVIENAKYNKYTNGQ